MAKIRANYTHPTTLKVNRLARFMRDTLKLELSISEEAPYRLIIKDMETGTPLRYDWDLCNKECEFLTKIPHSGDYRLCYDTNKTVAGMMPVAISEYDQHPNNGK